MQYVIVDFEMTRDGRKGAGHRHSEMIEIGAVRVSETFELLDEYKHYIKPQDGRIQESITKLTGISNEMVEQEKGFAEVVPDFLDWIGAEETVVYSWSLSDLVQLKGESERKGVTDERLQPLFSRWVDFQKEFGDVLGVEQSIKLTYALKAANIEFEGQVHDGLSDAQNTARLFVLSRDEKDLRSRMATLIEMFQPKEKLSSSFASFLPKDLVLSDGKE